MDTATPSISIEALRAVLGTPHSPLVIDVRKRPAFDADGTMIASAIRRAPAQLSSWNPRPGTSRELVVYCAHGHEVSQGAARALCAAGLRARYLEGGIEAWAAQRAPSIARRPELGVPGTGSRWVTRERPKIDRIACPWLIRRFIDPLADFAYFPADRVMESAKGTGAIAYDVPGVLLSHDDERCSFDAFLREFTICDSALDDLALIVRGADTARLDLAPQAAGLLAVSLGLSVNIRDDHAMLEQGMVIYDALYAWCRFARSETHSWNYGKAT